MILDEMAAPRELAIRKTSEQVDPLLEHIMKCVIYRDKLDSDWVNTVASICDYLNNFEVKGQGRLKVKDYNEILKPYDSVGDYLREIKGFKLKNDISKKYPTFTLNKNDSILLKDLYETFIDEVIILFTHENEMDNEYFKNLFLEAFHNIILKYPSNNLMEL